MQLAISVQGKSIRLSDERWAHIVEGHPEMAGHRNEVLLTIAAPDFVVEGANDELMATRFIRMDKALVAVYKEEKKDGFVLTAYFTTKTDKLLNRKIQWKK